MKVRTAFTFSEPELRTIRATVGRGGVASRKECLTFIDRAVRTAIAAAPEPKPARTRIATPKPAPVAPLTPDEQTARERENRDSIARKFGHQTSGMQHRLPTEKEMARYRKAKDNMGVTTRG